MKNLGFYISSFKNGVKNLIKWFPVIWKDRDWSEHYIYILLLKKVENKIKFFQSDNCYSANSDEVVNQLEIVRKALNRLVKDEYYEEACVFYGVEPYNFDNDFRRDFYELEEKIRNEDIKVVFSKEVSEQIRGWWD